MADPEAIRLSEPDLLRHTSFSVVAGPSLACNLGPLGSHGQVI